MKRMRNSESSNVSDYSRGFGFSRSRNKHDAGLTRHIQNISRHRALHPSPFVHRRTPSLLTLIKFALHSPSTRFDRKPKSKPRKTRVTRNVMGKRSVHVIRASLRPKRRRSRVARCVRSIPCSHASAFFLFTPFVRRF